MISDTLSLEGLGLTHNISSMTPTPTPQFWLKWLKVPVYFASKYFWGALFSYKFNVIDPDCLWWE